MWNIQLWNKFKKLQNLYYQTNYKDQQNKYVYM
jgi:hypothetical protein